MNKKLVSPVDHSQLTNHASLTVCEACRSQPAHKWRVIDSLAADTIVVQRQQSIYRKISRYNRKQWRVKWKIQALTKQQREIFVLKSKISKSSDTDKDDQEVCRYWNADKFPSCKQFFFFKQSSRQKLQTLELKTQRSKWWGAKL